MNGHPIGCQCDACLGRQAPAGSGVYAYAASWPKSTPLPELAPVVALYMVTTPDQPFPGGKTTWETEESPELVELRKIGVTLEGMRKLAEQFLARARKPAKKRRARK